jgi:hypothetical protein
MASTLQLLYLFEPHHAHSHAKSKPATTPIAGLVIANQNGKALPRSTRVLMIPAFPFTKPASLYIRGL